MTEAEFLRENGWSNGPDGLKAVVEGVSPPITITIPRPVERIIDPEATAERPKASDLSSEAWREYEFGPPGSRVTVRIEDPRSLYYRPGGTTHRVLDGKGVVHCVPVPGAFGCVLRWAVKSGNPHVSF